VKQPHVLQKKGRKRGDPEPGVRPKMKKKKREFISTSPASGGKILLALGRPPKKKGKKRETLMAAEGGGGGKSHRVGEGSLRIFFLRGKKPKRGGAE